MRSKRLLGLIQLLHEVITQTAVEYGSRPACQIHAADPPPPRPPARRHPARPSRCTAACGALRRRADERPRHPSRRFPRTVSPPPRARRSALGFEPAHPPRRACPVSSISVYHDTFVRFGKALVGFDPRAECLQVESRERRLAVDVDRALRIADRDVLEVHGVDVSEPVDQQLPATVGRAAGKVLGGEARATHIHSACVEPGDPRTDRPRGGLDRELVLAPSSRAGAGT